MSAHLKKHAFGYFSLVVCAGMGFAAYTQFQQGAFIEACVAAFLSGGYAAFASSHPLEVAMRDLIQAQRAIIDTLGRRAP